ncbi:ABC-type uncharacterized transport system fused permease/ATPase subunit [Phyllobacterium ifriqiyense]|uniref:ABC-type uncharacterized transport system fused permease/ATPase subunit n=2 Tax=Phyllobacteriaceae TaxID=69277 RepID=A0ABU0S8T6_9HYPH|nr:ABC-type uncharacterized transport system fused permease/ATPase subunit [Phyllobacterium ifriqiyense]
MASMCSFWGLLRAYWTSERWVEAWTLTIAIALLTAAASKASVWMAMASGELINSLVDIHDPFVVNPLNVILANAGILVAIVAVKEIGFIGVRHLLSTTLHRKWRGWLNGRFGEALLDEQHTHYHLQQGSSAEQTPDNIDQRIQESIKGMTGGAIGLAMGVLGVTMSILFVGQKLIELSTPIPGLDFLGDYGSATLAFTAIALYVPVSTWIAMRIGRALEKLTLAMQQSEGSYRSELTTLLRRSFQVAAANGETVQKSLNDKLYRSVDNNWGRFNVFDACYMSFTSIYNFFSARIVAYIPGLLPYMGNTISFKNYITGSELVGSMINECSWFIHVMPAIANLKANARRVTELAQAVERVSQPSEYYRSTGVSEFKFATQHEAFGVSVRGLELMHRDSEAKAFLTLGNMRLRKGQWAYIKGDSGSGKTCLLKAMNGLWGYGRGEIFYPKDAATMYAAQEVKLPGVSLKQLVCLPMDESRFGDSSVAAALHRAGMGDFIENLGEECRDGTSWDQLLSGGQKQKLVLARILLHKPAVLFLDEATGALDPDSKIAFHQAIKDHCAGTTVISVMHEIEAPRSVSGENFYTHILEINGGTAIQRPLLETLVEPDPLPTTNFPLIAAE